MAKKLNIHDDRLLVKVEDTKKTTESGIVLPESSVSKSQMGVVYTVGKGRRTQDGTRIPLDVKPGDKVLFDKFAGSPIVLNDTEYLLLKEYDIIGTIVDE